MVLDAETIRVAEKKRKAEDESDDGRAKTITGGDSADVTTPPALGTSQFKDADKVMEEENLEVNEYNTLYQCDDHDLVLISAKTRLQFRVHSYRLQTGSQVFSDMVIHSGRATWNRSNDVKWIRFTDTELETDPVIKLFLDSLYNRWDHYFDKAKGIDIDDHLDLIRFTDKYDCAEVIQSVTRAMRLSLLEHKGSPFDIFVFGAHCDDLDLCSTAIKMQGAETWNQVSASSLRTGVNNGSTLDLRTASRSQFELIPLKFSHALLRATYVAMTDDDGDFDWDQISIEFNQLMEREKKAVEEDKAKREKKRKAKEINQTTETA